MLINGTVRKKNISSFTKRNGQVAEQYQLSILEGDGDYPLTCNVTKETYTAVNKNDDIELNCTHRTVKCATPFTTFEEVKETE